MNSGEIENKNKNVLSNEENEEVSVSSIFKKKEKSELSDKKIISAKEKSVISQQGGNKIVSHKSEEKKKHAKIKSESEKSDSSSDEEETETSESKSNSSSYSNTSDIYKATETEDGLNKAYGKLTKEMDTIAKKQKGGKISGKEVVKRINFILSGLQILDNVKKSNKKKKKH